MANIQLAYYIVLCTLCVKVDIVIRDWDLLIIAYIDTSFVIIILFFWKFNEFIYAFSNKPVVVIMEKS